MENELAEIIDIESSEIDEVCKPIKNNASINLSMNLEELENLDLPIQFNTIHKLSSRNIILQFQLTRLNIFTNKTFTSLLKGVL
jgi:hypothetical protein